MDWLWQAAQDFANEWQPRHFGLVAGIVGMAVVFPFLTLVHELGHALAVLVLRRRAVELRVGDQEPMFRFRVRGLRVTLGPQSDEGIGGYLLYADASPRPWATIVIALGGPLASLAGAVGTGVVAVSLPYSYFSLVLGFATLGGLALCLGNLQATGEDPAEWSDGRWIQVAWHELRA